MAHESFSVSEFIPAPPERIYSAWLDAAAHSDFTGDQATVEPFVGGRHTEFGGYAEGTNLELHPGQRIVQTWRSKDFPEGSPDSRLEVTMEETAGGTMLTIFHTDIPSGQGEQLRDGWLKYYLEPLKRYFNDDDEDESTDADARPSIVGDTEEETTPGSPMAAGGAAPSAAPRKPAAKAAARKPAVKASAKAAPKTEAKAARKPKAKAKAKAAARKPKPKAKAAKARRPAARPAKAKKAAKKPTKKAAKKPTKKAAKKAAKKRR